MTTAVASVDCDTLFKEIVRILRQRNVSAVPVIRADSVVVGVVREPDLLPGERNSEPRRLTQLRRLDDMLKAGSVLTAGLMTAPEVTVEADDTLSRVARIMAKAQVNRRPVVDADDRRRGASQPR